MIKCYKDLEVYQLSYKLGMEIFELSKKFPKEESYNLTSQIRDSSRSIPANIAEGWTKRQHTNLFKKHLLDALGSVDETKVWLDFSLDCKYMLKEKHEDLIHRYEELGKRIYNLIKNWKTYKE
jgi:four helix bundle protein